MERGGQGRLLYRNDVSATPCIGSGVKVVRVKMLNLVGIEAKTKSIVHLKC